MPKMSLIIAAFTLTLSGGYKIFAHSPVLSERVPLVQAREPGLKGKIFERKITALHHYYMVAHMNYHRSHLFMGEVVVKNKINELEQELVALTRTLTPPEKNFFREKIESFSHLSRLHALHVAVVAQSLGVKGPTQLKTKRSVIEAEYKRLVPASEFQVIEKNIEHLSHLQFTNLKKGRIPASTQEIPTKATDPLDWPALTIGKIK